MVFYSCSAKSAELGQLLDKYYALEFSLNIVEVSIAARMRDAVALAYFESIK